jgi:mannose-6-phosphate isomerase-like protein (cupin superfamily)
MAPTSREGDTINERRTLGPNTGFHALSQAVLGCEPGRSQPRGTGTAEEVLFVLRGRGTLHLADAEYELEPESGAHLEPGEQYELENPAREPLDLLSVRIPDPDRHTDDAGTRSVVRRLADQDAEKATTEREFRIVADPSSGLRSATHFVGYIPTARAPEHLHIYDEVIYVLDGRGEFYAGEIREPLVPGSCIQLPARTVHCLENTGTEVMRVHAVLRPAGSPAAAYYPDGTPAHGDAPPLQTS